MIFDSLANYYKKSSSINTNPIPPGFQKKAIQHTIIIDSNGKFITINSNKIENITSHYYVPSEEKITGRAVKANLFYDVIERVLGAVDSQNNPKQSTIDLTKDRHDLFKKKIYDYRGKHISIDAIISFLNDTNEINNAISFVNQNGIGLKKWTIFKIDGHATNVIDEITKILCVAPVSNTTNNNVEKFCPIENTNKEVAALHPNIKGAALVSFNKSAFCSFGLEQGNNANVSTDGAYNYSSGLRELLESEDHNFKFVQGSGKNTFVNTFVFWSTSSSPLDKSIELFLQNINNSNQDDPSAGVIKVKSLLRSIFSTPSKSTEENTFYFLHLTQNMSRWVIQSYKEDSIINIGKNIYSHFEDLEIDGLEIDGITNYTLFSLLDSIKISKDSVIPTHIIRETLSAILSGENYPIALLRAILSRVKAEQLFKDDKYYDLPKRASLLKAIINRRNKNNNNWRKIQMSLDKDNVDVGYLLGRSLAIFERIQYNAHGFSNIRQRFAATYSTRPATVSGKIGNLSIHHLDKSPSIFLEKERDEVMSKIGSNIPNVLTLNEQASFFLGYYHQRNSLFTKQ